MYYLAMTAGGSFATDITRGANRFWRNLRLYASNPQAEVYTPTLQDLAESENGDDDEVLITFVLMLFRTRLLRILFLLLSYVEHTLSRQTHKKNPLDTPRLFFLLSFLCIKRKKAPSQHLV